MDIKCKNHPDNWCLFYCVTHDLPCCSECKRTEHQITCDMEKLDPNTNEKDIGRYMVNLMKRMIKTTSLLDELHHGFYQSKQHLLRQKEKFEQDLQKFRQELDAKIDQMETGIRDNFNDLFNKEIEIVKQREIGVLRKNEVVHKLVQEVEYMAKKDPSIKSYVYMMKMNSSFSAIEKHSSDIEKQFEYVKLSLIIPNVFLDLVKCLKVVPTCIKRSTLPGVESPEPNTASPTSKEKEIQNSGQLFHKVGVFSIAKDTDFHSSSDMRLLPNGDIAVCNLNNRRLTVYDQNGIPNIDMDLSHNPLYLAPMVDDWVAMTLANERKIVVLDVRKRQVRKQIQMDDECHGIAYANGKLFINRMHKGLRFLNTDFEVDNEISHITGKLILCGRRDGTLVCGKLLSKEVFCVDICGLNLFEVVPPDLEYLHGIAVNDAGEIFCTGYLSNTIHRIEANGENVSTILTSRDGINLPRSLCYDETAQSVLIINNDGQIIVTYCVKKM